MVKNEVSGDTKKKIINVTAKFVNKISKRYKMYYYNFFGLTQYTKNFRDRELKYVYVPF